MTKTIPITLVIACLLMLVPWTAMGQAPSGDLQVQIAQAVDKVRPALVRIQVVAASYYNGREEKVQEAGSGAIITPEGLVITNHHVAGHAAHLTCTLANKELVDAELVGTDALTDIAVIRLKGEPGRVYPFASFGDSGAVKVGDQVLAMGSPMALSQSVTLGIISNTELIMPKWGGPGGRLMQDGEDVGSLVRWIAHDAPIYFGNSGGPLVSLQGEIIGINEISLGSLGGAIPGNLAARVFQAISSEGKVKRAWLGVEIQPRLRHGEASSGVLVSGALDGSPAANAGLQAGDIIVAINNEAVDVKFGEQLPLFNQAVAVLPIGQPVTLTVMRGAEKMDLSITPSERQDAFPREKELRGWGVTGRNLSYVLAKQLKRDATDGVLVTSLRPGGPAAEAKPSIAPGDVVMEMAGKPVKNLVDLVAITAEVTKDTTAPVPVLVGFDRRTERLLTVVKVGLSELEDPGLEVTKAWLPVGTQVISRDLATLMGKPDLTGFRVTQVYKGTTAEAAGLQIGDLLLAVDGEKLTAAAPEDYDDLPQLIRAYRVGDNAELTVLRGADTLTIPVELIRSPHLPREMKRYRDIAFEFTTRDITFFDKAERKLEDTAKGVLVEEVQSGGWAALGMLSPGDLLLSVNGGDIASVEVLETVMKETAAGKPAFVVLKVLRGINTMFLELEPKWDNQATQ